VSLDVTGGLAALASTNPTAFATAIGGLIALGTGQYFANVLANDVSINPTALGGLSYAGPVEFLSVYSPNYLIYEMVATIRQTNVSEVAMTFSPTEIEYYYNLTTGAFAASTVLGAINAGTFVIPTVYTCVYSSGANFLENYVGFLPDEYTDGFFAGVLVGLAFFFFVVAYLGLFFCKYQKR